MATYKIEINEPAGKELKKIEGIHRERIIERIRRLARNPRPADSQILSGEEKYRIRQGYYRVLYKIFEDVARVVVVRIASISSKSLERFHVTEVLKQIGIDNYEITDRESPDFLITFQGQQIGIEVTDGSPEPFMRGRKIKETNYMSLAGLRKYAREQKTKGRIENPELKAHVEDIHWQNANEALMLFMEDMEARWIQF